jgi:phosphatidate cytidylyltransferase
MTRIITSLIGIPILIYLIEFAPIPAFVTVVFIAMLLCLYEYFAITGIKETPALWGAGFIVACILFLSFYWTNLRLLSYLPAASIIVLLAALLSRLDFARALKFTAYSLFGAFYVGGLLGYLVGIRLVNSAFATGADLVMMLFVIIWTGDTFAYFVGRKVGRHQLTVVSPRKTVEGAIAGLIFSIISAAICKFAFVREMPLIHALILGGVVGIVGQLGDLCESLLKRSANVKDSGSILPGHGGMLDRLDSLLFGAPAMYYYFSFILRQ